MEAQKRERALTRFREQNNMADSVRGVIKTAALASVHGIK